MTGEELGARFLTAIESRDWSLLASCFAPEARFKALVPNKERPFRDHSGRSPSAQQIRVWFDDSDVHELLDSSTEVIVDRVHVRYRVRCHDADGWFMVEQHAFLEPGPEGIESCNLLCSGFRPVEEPLQRA